MIGAMAEHPMLDSFHGNQMALGVRLSALLASRESLLGVGCVLS